MIYKNLSNFGGIFIFFCCDLIILWVFTKEEMGLQFRLEIIRGTVWTAVLSSCRPVLTSSQYVLCYLYYSSFWAPSRSSVYLIIWGVLLKFNDDWFSPPPWTQRNESLPDWITFHEYGGKNDDYWTPTWCLLSK